ncbi:unnamed protein product [Owenia fusiformis]|uniref:Uncharacterized protein n=1 Tax=Owenia fusiformis TaxID=6347 RepID=A0A8S4N376_OWEFU|nr:unnamed protein product [Owenia fusiformis]
MAGSLRQKSPKDRILSYDRYSTRSQSLPGGDMNELHIFTKAKHKQVFHFGTSEKLPWEQRKDRMNQAIAWIKSEVTFMKFQDKMLTHQFSRCQKVIGELQLRMQKFRICPAVSSDSTMQDGLLKEWETEEFNEHSSESSGDSDSEHFKFTVAETKNKRSKSCDDILNHSKDIHEQIKAIRESFLSTNENLVENENEDEIFEIQDAHWSNTAGETTRIIPTNIPVIVDTDTSNNSLNAENINSAIYDTNPISFEKTVNKSSMSENTTPKLNSYILSDDYFKTGDALSGSADENDIDGHLSCNLDDIIIEIDDDDVTSSSDSSIGSFLSNSLQYVTVDEGGSISFDMSLDGGLSYTENDEWSINGQDN